MTKPTQDSDNQKSNGWKKPDDVIAQMKAEAEQHKATPDPKQDLPFEFTAKDIIYAYNLGQWFGKRNGRLRELQRTVPHIEKQNTRLARAGRKVGLLKRALRAQIDANTLSAEALDD
jgi:hypothetical protein